MPLLEIADLSIRFGGIVALDGLCLQAERGQIVGIIGPNGAGKTTVFNCLTGVYTPERGSIHFSGLDLRRMRPYQIVAAGVARTFQNLELFGSMSVLENLLVGQHTALRNNLLDDAFRLPRSLREERRGLGRANDVMDFLRLQPYRNLPVAGLPFGLKKRVELARALVSSPRLLLLDEPANGLSQEEVPELAGLIGSMREQMDLTILLVEHHVGLVMAVSHRVCVMDFGRKIAEGSPAEVQRDPAVIKAYLGETVA